MFVCIILLCRFTFYVTVFHKVFRFICVCNCNIIYVMFSFSNSFLFEIDKHDEAEDGACLLLVLFRRLMFAICTTRMHYAELFTENKTHDN